MKVIIRVRVPGRAQFQFDPRAALGFDYRALAGVRDPRPGLRKPSLLQRERLMLCARIFRIRKPSNG